LTTTCRGLEALFHLPLIFAGSDAESFYNDLKSLKQVGNDEKACLQTTALAIADSKHFHGLLLKVTENDAVMSELRPEVDGVNGSLAGAEATDYTDDKATMLS